MTDYTHYSLFDGYVTVSDFRPLPAGGLQELLADLYTRCEPQPNHCVACGNNDAGHSGSLHPGASQVSFYIGRRYCVILMTRDCVAEHAVELASEGNESAMLAEAAAKN